MTDGDRRDHILQAADRLLKHYGPAKTTIADVAREASVGVGTVYLEFPSKDALVEELSRARYRAVLEAMRGALRTRGSFRTRLQAALDARVAHFFEMADEGAHACDLLHCMSPAVKAAWSQFREEERSLVLGVLVDAHRAGEFDVRRPEAAARAVLHAYVVFSPPWMFNLPREELLEGLRAMHDLVFLGLVRRNGPRTG